MNTTAIRVLLVAALLFSLALHPLRVVADEVSQPDLAATANSASAEPQNEAERSVVLAPVNPPTVATADAMTIAGTVATLGGEVTSDGGGPVTERGVCWSTVGSPTIEDSKLSDGAGTGVFTCYVTGLNRSSSYFVRAYATNSAGTSYGKVVTFSTTAATSAAADILWRNSQTGKNVVWEMDGASYIASLTLTEVNTNWKVSAVGDMDKDGKSDILWRHTRDGRVQLWRMNGATMLESEALETVPNLAWIMVGIGDFNNDNKPDILWRNPNTSKTVAWLMSNNTRLGMAWADEVNATWTIEAVGDIDGDGYLDILWRNYANNRFVIWLMAGTQGDLVLKQSIRLQDMPEAWRARGVGDFNNDGKQDILWRNTNTGKNVVWLMDGTTRKTNVEIKNVPAGAGWDIGGVGVFH